MLEPERRVTHFLPAGKWSLQAAPLSSSPGIHTHTPLSPIHRFNPPGTHHSWEQARLRQRWGLTPCSPQLLSRRGSFVVLAIPAAPWVCWLQCHTHAPTLGLGGGMELVPLEGCSTGAVGNGRGINRQPEALARSTEGVHTDHPLASARSSAGRAGQGARSPALPPSRMEVTVSGGLLCTPCLTHCLLLQPSTHAGTFMYHSTHG